MTYLYKIVRKIDEGLYLLKHPRWGQQLWALCKLTKKKLKHPCSQCGENLTPHSYRPLTHAGNRMERICEKCLEEQTK